MMFGDESDDDWEVVATIAWLVGDGAIVAIGLIVIGWLAGWWG